MMTHPCILPFADTWFGEASTRLSMVDIRWLAPGQRAGSDMLNRVDLPCEGAGS